METLPTVLCNIIYDYKAQLEHAELLRRIMFDLNWEFKRYVWIGFGKPGHPVQVIDISFNNNKIKKIIVLDQFGTLFE